MPDVEEITESEFKDRVKGILAETLEDEKEIGDALDRGIDEKIAEEVEKAFEKWKSKTETQKNKAMQSLEDMLVKSDAERGHMRRKDDIEPGSVFGRFAPFLVDEAQKNGSVDLNDRDQMKRVAEAAEKGIGERGDYKDGFVQNATEKFMGVGDVSSGGALTTTPVTDDYIELLRPNTVMRSAGARTFTMPAGSIEMPQLVTGATTESVGEGEEADASELGWKMKSMKAVRMSSLVALSNQLIDRAPQGVEEIVRGDVRDSAIVEEDRQMLFGDGTQGELEGVYNQTDDSQKFQREDDGGDTNIDTMTRDLAKAIYKQEKNDQPLMNPGWTSHPRFFRGLMTLRGSDSWLYAAQLAEGNLMGYPIYPSSQHPISLDDSGDGSNDETRIGFIDFSQCMIGDTKNLRILSSQEASVELPSGWKSAFAADMTFVVAHHEVGFLLRRTNAASWIEGADFFSGFDA